MKMRMKLRMKIRSHRYGINRTKPRHGCECSKYKMCLSIKMVVSISNT